MLCLQMWRYCAASPLALEILLNSYDRIPPGDFWVEAVPPSAWKVRIHVYLYCIKPGPLVNPLLFFV